MTIEFVGYTEDCIVSGRLRLQAERLTDLLNRDHEYVLKPARVESLADGRAIELRSLTVRRDELLLVQVAGPRGDRRLRHRTHEHPVAVRLGPFEVRGCVHAVPGSDPVASLRHRSPMVPLTEATIEYVRRGRRERLQLASAIVNRELTDWIAAIDDDELTEPADHPYRPVVTSPRLRAR